MKIPLLRCRLPPLVHETKNAAAAPKQWCAQRPEKKNTNRKKNKMKSDETNAPKCTEHSRTSERNDARQKKTNPKIYLNI